MAGAVRITGLRETLSALNRVNREAAKIVKAELVKAAEPVAATAREKLSRYPGASTRTIGPRAVTRGVYVTQRARKVTGLRGDFGALQMTRVLIPALEEHEDDLVDAADDALTRLARSAGF